jgi:anaerobic selenocysteine-containing dehydrogenase
VTTQQRVCPLCEATCGLDITLDDSTGEVLDVRGDDLHVFSHGYVCPKAVGLAHLERDPDRLPRPLVRRQGRLVATTWGAAFAEVEERLVPILQEHGRNAAAVYLGNPNVHNLSGLLYAQALIRALGTRNVFSASTVDQRPKEISSGLMFGGGLTVGIPDVDHTQLLVILGANPLESNGSLMTAPDMRGRLRKLRQRGGRLVVIDPRRTRTAQVADLYLPIRPGSDALLLAAMANTLLVEGRARPGRLAELCNGLDQLPAALAPFTPETVAGRCGISATAIRALVAELATSPAAAVYGRVGTTTQRFGTLASWLVDVLNVLTGNLDRRGGVMFPLAAAGQRNSSGPGGSGSGIRMGRWRSRVRGAPEALGELPVACMAEEIETEGEGRIRALITLAGNPVLSTPNGARLAVALERLDLLVSVDLYQNETTGRADVVLPVPTALARTHFDLAFSQLAIRNVAVWSPALLPLPDGMPDEWQTLLRLAAIAAGLGAAADIRPLDDLVAQQLVGRQPGIDADALFAEVGDRTGPERLVDLLLRIGPYGAHGRQPWCDPDNPDTQPGLTLAALEARPHGVDLGPLMARLPEVLRTTSGRIELAPEPVLADMPRLRGALDEPENGLVLIGRRDLRTNNSWMHNIEVLARGERRCTLQVNPADAERLDVKDGERVRVRSRAGSLEVTAEVTDAVMPGVVSIPHGWGHGEPNASMRVAAAHPGVNINLLVDEAELDPLSGTAVLNGVPVTVEAALASDTLPA